MVEVLVGLGSNLPRRREHLAAAVAALDAAPDFEVVEVSPWIETAAVGGPADQPAFLNGALRGCTRLGPADLLDLLHAIEHARGRDRDVEERHGPRTLDLDLLFYGERTIDLSDLVVPHPRLEDRTFVLEPLAHLVPERRLPRTGLTVRARLAALRASPTDSAVAAR